MQLHRQTETLPPPGSSAAAPADARYRYGLLALGWVLFLVSLPLPTAHLNLFMHWRGNASGLEFVSWLFLGIPRQIVSTFRDPRFGYVPLIDLVWWVAAIAAMVLFFISPFLIRRTLHPAALLTLRYLALVLLVFPATAFFPEALRYPQPRLGMIILAASQVCVLVAFWSPWPVLTSTANYFPVIPAADDSRQS